MDTNQRTLIANEDSIQQPQESLPAQSSQPPELVAKGTGGRALTAEEYAEFGHKFGRIEDLTYDAEERTITNHNPDTSTRTPNARPDTEDWSEYPAEHREVEAELRRQRLEHARQTKLGSPQPICPAGGQVVENALYEVEYHKDVPTMSWWMGRKEGGWKNFSWNLGFVGSFCLQKDSITFLVADCIGCSRMLTVQRKDVKSMRLIDRNVPPQWWDLTEYGARSGEWSEEPMGVDERHIVME